MCVKTVNRDILKLAVPALGALLAQPLFALLDTVMVGHLGTPALAGLSIASTILGTAIGLMVFLAYATTPRVARYFGAGKQQQAVQAGVDGAYLAVGISLLVTVLLLLLKTPLVTIFAPAHTAVADAAAVYLSVVIWGVPAMLFSFSMIGLERGLQNTTITLRVTAAAFALNAVLNAFFIYVCGLGIAGSALGTALAQWVMAAVFALRLRAHLQTTGARLRFHAAGVRITGQQGFWLFLRTLSIHGCILLTVATAAAKGAAATAAFAVLNSVFLLCAFLLDALAIAAQALIGRSFGSKNARYINLVIRQIMLWSVLVACGLGLLLALIHRLLPPLFTKDSAVLSMLPQAFLLLALSMLICGAVFGLDGVYIGASANKYLAVAGLINIALYAPALWWLQSQQAQLTPAQYFGLLAANYLLVYMTCRLITLSLFLPRLRRQIRDQSAF